MGKIIAFINEDGGAGKTTIPASLAVTNSLEWKDGEGNITSSPQRILLVDPSPKASLTRLFLKDREIPREQTLWQMYQHLERPYIHPTDNPNIFLLAGHDDLKDMVGFQYELLLKEKLQELRDEFDIIYIDTANNGTMVASAICASDEVVIVIKPSRDSFHGALKAIQQVQALNSRHALNAQIKEVILNKFAKGTSTSEMALNELKGEADSESPYRILCQYFRNQTDEGTEIPVHVVPESATFARLQFNYSNLGGYEWRWLNASKVIRKIAQDWSK